MDIERGCRINLRELNCQVKSSRMEALPKLLLWEFSQEHWNAYHNPGIT